MNSCTCHWILTVILLWFLSSSDDHGFSPMHWASKEGHLNIVDMLISRGAKINSTNMGDDTALHLASAHGHREIVMKVILKILSYVNGWVYFIYKLFNNCCNNVVLTVLMMHTVVIYVVDNEVIFRETIDAAKSNSLHWFRSNFQCYWFWYKYHITIYTVDH